MSVIDPIVIDERVAVPDAEVLLLVPDNLEYFKGHFPGVPIVPGVVQIKWAMAIANRCLKVAGEFGGMEALKFQQVMGPNIQVTLKLKYRTETDKLHFSFQSDRGRYSSGRLLLRRTS